MAPSLVHVVADDRTLRQKLEAMANQDTSPHEADIARRKLDALPNEVEASSPYTDHYTYYDDTDTDDYERESYPVYVDGVGKNFDDLSIADVLALYDMLMRLERTRG